MLKCLGDSNICMEGMVKVYNRALETGEIGGGWNESKTVMIGKVRKPQASQHRPIALMNVGCKLFMGMVKDKLVEQRIADFRVGDLQSGFTEGRRMEENLLILGYCVEECYRRREELVVVAVDFSKAFDSVNRSELVETMMYFKCDPRLIELLSRIYVGDRTRIYREGEEMGEMEVWNGIRQGCTVSPHLFVMVVGRIIERVLQSGLGWEVDGMRVPVLFYADDGLLMARSREEAVRMMELLEATAGRYGLRVNKEKTVGMVFNDKGGSGMIGGVKIVEEMRYLGVKVVGKRDCYGENRKEKLGLATKMSNLTFSVIARSCDRLLIGKTFWKSVVLPSVLSSDEVMVWTKSERDRLQRTENGVWRKVFMAPSYTPVAALQGEVGCSSVHARDMKGKIKFAKVC